MHHVLNARWHESRGPLLGSGRQPVNTVIYQTFFLWRSCGITRTSLYDHSGLKKTNKGSTLLGFPTSDQWCELRVRRVVQQEHTISQRQRCRKLLYLLCFPRWDTPFCVPWPLTAPSLSRTACKDLHRGASQPEACRGWHWFIKCLS